MVVACELSLRTRIFSVFTIILFEKLAIWWWFQIFYTFFFHFIDDLEAEYDGYTIFRLPIHNIPRIVSLAEVYINHFAFKNSEKGNVLMGNLNNFISNGFLLDWIPQHTVISVSYVNMKDWVIIKIIKLILHQEIAVIFIWGTPRKTVFFYCYDLWL